MERMGQELRENAGPEFDAPVDKLEFGRDFEGGSSPPGHLLWESSPKATTRQFSAVPHPCSGLEQ